MSVWSKEGRDQASGWAVISMFVLLEQRIIHISDTENEEATESKRNRLNTPAPQEGL